MHAGLRVQCTVPAPGTRTLHGTRTLQHPAQDRNLALLVAVGAGRGLLALRDGGGGVEGRRGEGSRPQVLGERAAAARAGFVAERAEGVERWLGAALAAMGGAESEATDEAEAVRREVGALAGAL